MLYIDFSFLKCNDLFFFGVDIKFVNLAAPICILVFQPKRSPISKVLMTLPLQSLYFDIKG